MSWNSLIFWRICLVCSETLGGSWFFLSKYTRTPLCLWQWHENAVCFQNKTQWCVRIRWTGAKCQWSHMESQLVRAGVSRQGPEWKGVILHATFKVEWIINGQAMDTESCYQYFNTFTSNFRLTLPDCHRCPIHNLNLFDLADCTHTQNYNIDIWREMQFLCCVTLGFGWFFLSL